MSNNTLKIIAEPGKQEILIEREFDAPRDSVWKVLTDPKLIPQWWGPRNLTTKVDKMEVRSGGEWRYIHSDPNGTPFGFHGVYHEVTAPSRIIDTFEFEGLPEAGHVSLETMTLIELPGGRTLLKVIDVFQTVADRDGMVQSGMESGMKESYERLEELLQK